MVTTFRLCGSASARTFGMCEQAARTLSMVAIEVLGWKSTVTHCWLERGIELRAPGQAPRQRRGERHAPRGSGRTPAGGAG